MTYECINETRIRNGTATHDHPIGLGRTRAALSIHPIDGSMSNFTKVGPAYQSDTHLLRVVDITPSTHHPIRFGKNVAWLEYEHFRASRPRDPRDR